MLVAAVSVLGLCIGSFVNAVALRYDPERFLLAPTARGRSHCPHCRRELRWFELVPLISFALQRGRCRSCNARLSLQYPLVELATALVFGAIAWRVFEHPLLGMHASYVSLALWLIVGAMLVLTSLIDLRLRLIPNELVVGLSIAGIAVACAGISSFSATGGSFLGSYAILLGLREYLWLNRLVGVVAGAGFFGALFLFTRGRGVGLGDLKLAAALGLVFGWPDNIIVVLLSFIIGTIVVMPSLVSGRVRMKGAVPFGPFLCAAAIVTLVWGNALLRLYFSLFGII